MKKNCINQLRIHKEKRTNTTKKMKRIMEKNAC